MMIEKEWAFKESKIERPVNNKEVLSPHQYLRDIRKEAARAEKSILLKTMVFEESSEGGQAAVETFKNAPPNVRKQFYIDWHSRLIFEDRIYAIDRNILRRPQAWSLKKKKYEVFIEHFKKAGVMLEFTNKPTNRFGHLVPHIGRDHIKATIIDDGKISYFGGVNFSGADDVDFMVRFEGDVAKKISNALDDIHTGHMKKDESRPLDEHSILYIDAGTPGESLIMREAATMIAKATQSIENTSLMTPDGLIAKELRNAARKKIHTEVIVSSEEVFAQRGEFLGNEYIINTVRKLNRLRGGLEKSGVSVTNIPQFLHAKLLIVDRGTNRARAYFGTHNLSEAGVKAGTREWGIFTTDPELIRNLSEFYVNCRSLASANT